LKLMEDYDVRIDDHIATFLPEFTNMTVGDTTTKTPITLRHVLTHTSGIGYGRLWTMLGAGDATDEWIVKNLDLWSKEGATDTLRKYDTLEKYVKKLSEMPLKFEPGTAFAYAPGAVIVARVIEVVSGMKAKEFFKKHFFQPMCISIGWGGPEDRTLPLHYLEDIVGGETKVGIPPFFDVSILQHPTMGEEALLMDAQLTGTTSDIITLARMIEGKGTVDGVQVLSSTSIDLLFKNFLPGGKTMTAPPNFIKNTPYNGQNPYGFSLGGLLAMPGAVENTGLKQMTSGTFGWFGAAGTFYSHHPQEGLSFIFMTHKFMPHLASLSKLISGAWEGQLYNLMYTSISERKSVSGVVKTEL